MKKLLENFFELRKHPSCIILSVIGWCDIIAVITMVLMLMTRDEILFMLFFAYSFARSFKFSLYMLIFPLIFIIERIFNLQFKNKIIENNKIYSYIWLIGFIGIIISSFILLPYFIYLTKDIKAF